MDAEKKDGGFVVQERELAQRLGVGLQNLKTRHRDDYMKKRVDWDLVGNVVTYTREAAEKVCQSHGESLQEVLGKSEAGEGTELAPAPNVWRLARVVSNTQNLKNRRVLNIELAAEGAARPSVRSASAEEFQGTGDVRACRVRDVKMFFRGMLVPVRLEVGHRSIWTLACRNPKNRGRICFPEA